MPIKYVKSHMLKVMDAPTKGEFIMFLNWGDDVEVVEDTAPRAKVLLKIRTEEKDGGIVYVDRDGWVDRNGLEGSTKVLKVNVIDVQQGDGMVIEAPDGSTIIMDGGDNQMFARYLASRFRCHTVQSPKVVDAILITHGDADHFSGLSKIEDSETHAKDLKRLFLWPRRIFHNGIVKRPSKVNGQSLSDLEMLGATTDLGDGKLPVITGLVDDLLAVPDAEMNLPFKNWKKTIQHWNANNKPGAEQPTHMKRLRMGSQDMAFFENRLKAARPDSEVALLGPIETSGNGVSGLRFLRTPAKDPEGGKFTKSPSASHTINGHSVILKIKYGNIRFVFAGDLNEEAEQILAAQPGVLETEFLKVPHHGSADYSPEFLEACAPLVSVISSGDESAKKEFIHPRANLLGSLGRAAPVKRPLIFCTELTAFFEVMGPSVTTDANKESFFGFKRAAFGMIRVRTDGDVMVVTTDSAIPDMKESYAFRVSPDANGNRVIQSILVDRL